MQHVYSEDTEAFTDAQKARFTFLLFFITTRFNVFYFVNVF